MMRTVVAVSAVGIGLALALPGRAAAQEWGTIKGKVVFGGEQIPERKVIDNKDCPCKEKVLSDDWVVNPKNKGVRWAFVWLAPEPNGPPLPLNPVALQAAKDKKAVIDQPRCMFEPHAVGIVAGQEVLAKNSATVSHNVKWGGHPLKNPGGNVILPAGASHTIKDLKADKLPVKLECNIHPWMTGWVRVFDNPYFAVTDADGNFEIKDAPAGTYRLVIWQEMIGYRGGAAGRDGTPVTIKAGAVTEVGPFDVKPNS